MNRIQKIGLVAGLAGLLFGTRARAEAVIDSNYGITNNHETPTISARTRYPYISGLKLLYDGYQERLNALKDSGKIKPSETKLPLGFYSLFNILGYEGVVPEEHDFGNIIRELSEVVGKDINRFDFYCQNSAVMEDCFVLKPGTKFRYIARTDRFNIFNF